MDGTLIDSMWIWPDIDSYYVKKYHLELPDDFHRAIEGKSYHETAQYFRDTFDMALSTEEIMDEWTQPCLPEIYRGGHVETGSGGIPPVWEGKRNPVRNCDEQPEGLLLKQH